MCALLDKEAFFYYIPIRFWHLLQQVATILCTVELCAGDRVRRACPPGSYCQGTFNILLDFLLTFSPPPTQCHFFSNFESDFDFINQCFPSLQIEINY